MCENNKQYIEHLENISYETDLKLTTLFEDENN